MQVHNIGQQPSDKNENTRQENHTESYGQAIVLKLPPVYFVLDGKGHTINSMI